MDAELRPPARAAEVHPQTTERGGPAAAPKPAEPGPAEKGPAEKGQLKRALRRQIAEESLAAVGLTGVSARYPWQLSGGTREDLEDLVLRVRQERDITILLVTHDIDESVYVGDRVIVLTPGPGRVRAELTVNLPAPRDQITTKALPEFVRLRTDVSRLVRDRPEPTQPTVPAAENQDHLSRTTPSPPSTTTSTRHKSLVDHHFDNLPWTAFHIREMSYLSDRVELRS